MQAKLEVMTPEQMVLPLWSVISLVAGVHWKDSLVALVYAQRQPPDGLLTVTVLADASSSPALPLTPCTIRSNARLAREEVLRNEVVSRYDHRNPTYNTIMPATTKTPMPIATSISGA